MRWTSVVFLAACAAGSPRPPGPGAAADAPEVRRDAERDYAIWLGGAQVGIAHEVERWSPAGVVVLRSETMQFLRGDVPVAIATTIEIAADAQLAPSRVTWTERARGVRRGEAVRDAAGWTVRDGDAAGSWTARNAAAGRGPAAPRRLPADAIPAELVPYVVRRDGRFAGPVFLPARGFVAGTGRIEPVAPRRLVARLVFAGDSAADPGAASATPAGAAEATIDLGDDAMPVRVVDGEGVIATRITAAQAAAPFAPVDLIAATSIPLVGSPGPTSAAGRRLFLEGDVALPPVPGQSARPAPDSAVAGAVAGVELALSPRLPGGLPAGPRGSDRTRDILWLVARVHGRIAPDLAALPASARAAAAATAGDCTTFALAYAALAAERAIPTRVVTGFRIDGDRLVRHRWAISWTGAAWIAVDAAFGAVPAGGDLVGVAVHTADDIGLVAGEAALTHVRAAAWR